MSHFLASWKVSGGRRSTTLYPRREVLVEIYGRRCRDRAKIFTFRRAPTLLRTRQTSAGTLAEVSRPRKLRGNVQVLSSLELCVRSRAFSNTLCPLRHGLNSHSNLVRAAQWLKNVTRREFFGHAFEGIRNELKGRAGTRANKMLKYYEYFSFEEAVLVEETAKIIRFVTADYLLLPTCSFLII